MGHRNVVMVGKIDIFLCQGDHISDFYAKISPIALPLTLAMYIYELKYNLFAISQSCKAI